MTTNINFFRFTSIFMYVSASADWDIIARPAIASPLYNPPEISDNFMKYLSEETKSTVNFKSKI